MLQPKVLARGLLLLSLLVALLALWDFRGGTFARAASRTPVPSPAAATPSPPPTRDSSAPLADRDLTLLVTGGLLTIIGTVFGAIVSDLLQGRRDTRSRAWRLEDEQLSWQREANLRRLEELDAFGRRVSTALSRIFMEIPDEWNPSRRTEQTTQLDQLRKELIDPLVLEFAHHAALTLALKSKGLQSAFQNLCDKAVDFRNLALDTRELSSLKKKVDEKNYRHIVQGLSVPAEYADFLLELDRLKTNLGGRGVTPASNPKHKEPLR